MKAGHVGLLTMLVVGCAHNQPAHRETHASREVREQRRENAAEEKRAEVAAVQRERSAEAYGTTPDNTAVNQRDRDSAAVTPLDQGTSDRDVELTAQIRKAMVGDSSLSFTAKNTKIITRDGLVTLRGTVVNAREKATIQKTALSIAGKDHVVDELEIEP
ncbi:MAG: BON domain-containing protein [Polyangiales bacterium]